MENEMEMEMELEMRAMEDIEIGTDMTPPLVPLTFSLHSSNIHTHCSACFSPLPHSPIPSNPPSPFFYCSPTCSAAHHLLPHHPATDSSDLRAALGLLLSHPDASRSGRVAGLLTNHHKLTWQNHSDDDEEEVRERIRVGAGALAAAIAELRGCREPNCAVLEDATDALCVVLTNAVEVQDKEGRAIGIAVFGPAFSWINHDCSPNTCYRFILSSPSPTSPSSQELKLRIAPFTRHSHESDVLYLLPL